VRAEWIALVLVLATTAASADKLDDAYDKTDKAYKHYTAARDQYATLRAQWDVAYKPINDHYPIEQAAYKAMADACTGAGRGSPACSAATLSWAASVKQRQALEWKASELDPKHEYDVNSLRARQTELQKAKADFDGAFDQAKSLFADARAHAHTNVDRQKIDDKLAQRDATQRDKFAATRGAGADAAYPKGGSNSGSSSSGSSIHYDPTSTVNSTVNRW